MQPFSMLNTVNSRTIFLDRKPVKYRVDVDQLIVGMHVVELDCPWEESPFLFQGFTLECAEDIKLVKDSCRYVYVDAVEESWIDVSKGRESQLRKSLKFISTGIKRDRNNYHNRAYMAARNHIEYVFKTMQLGKDLAGKSTQILLSDYVFNIIRNPSIVNVLAKIKADDEYTFQHSLNVSIYSVALGIKAGVDSFELKNLAVSALFHDIGKIRIPSDILNKPDSLAPHEMDEVKKHPEYGKKLLMSYSSYIYPGAVDVAYSHHERIDGKGYPRGIDGRKISRFTRIVAIVDAYDAMTSRRCYKEPVSSMQALLELKANAGTQFDQEYVNLFVELIGVCPPGYVVEMSNGEVGIVLSNTSGSDKPKVIILTDECKIPVKENVVDLSRSPVDRQGLPYSVLGDYRSGAFDIDVYDYIKRGLRISGLIGE